jgi:tetratricopeptide (TPR) repeat protein
VALVYLGATFAAAGHDEEAAGAWQTSLVDGSDFPQIYEWLGDTLMRTHDHAQARAILEEATAKWPADVRFARPLALLYATFGQGREAVRTLERYLSVNRTDQDALVLGVEWIYQLHVAGAVAHTAAADLKLAQDWAAAYAAAKGPQTALVKQWMQAIEKNDRP